MSVYSSFSLELKTNEAKKVGKEQSKAKSQSTHFQQNKLLQYGLR